MNHIKTFLICGSFFLTLNTICMEKKTPSKREKNVSVKTCDNFIFSLPQWKIDASRTLLTKQLFLAFTTKCSIEHLFPLTLRTIDDCRLQLYSDALDAPNLDEHFGKLTPQQKKLLTCVAGATELYDPTLSMKLLKIYLKPEIIVKQLYPCFPEMKPIQDHLKRSIILDNITFTGKFKQTTSSYADNRHMACRPNGYYNSIPRELNSINFDGDTPFISTHFGEDTWKINRIKAKSPTEVYFITPVKAITPESPRPSILNKKNLWLEHDAKQSAVIKKIIEHTNEINKIVFSNDGNYLATSSFDPNSELMLTYLNQQKDRPAFSALYLKEHVGEICALCFNNQSTILAVGSENGIQLWNIKEGSLLKKIDLPPGSIVVNNLQFSSDDTRLVASIPMQQRVMSFTILLLDTSNPSTIQTVATLPIITQDIHSLKFNSCDNSLIICTNNNVLILNGFTGKKIMETQPIPNHNVDFCFQTAVLMPSINLLATATLTDEKYCDTRLWDVGSKKIIATLLLDAKNMNGVGVTDDNRSVISTYTDNTMTKTDLYNDDTASFFDWVMNHTDLLQKYLLLRLYRAQQDNEPLLLHPNSIEHNTLINLPIKPYNIKNVIEKYLLKKTIGKKT